MLDAKNVLDKAAPNGPVREPRAVTQTFGDVRGKVFRVLELEFWHDELTLGERELLSGGYGSVLEAIADLLRVACVESALAPDITVAWLKARLKPRQVDPLYDFLRTTLLAVDLDALEEDEGDEGDDPNA